MGDGWSKATTAQAVQTFTVSANRSITTSTGKSERKRERNQSTDDNG